MTPTAITAAAAEPGTTAAFLTQGISSVRFTAEQYDAAIEALQAGKTQLAPDGDNCHICHGQDHQAFECGFNPLRAMALCEQIADQSEALHETLHYFAGYDRWFGTITGPRGVVVPPQEVEL